MGILPGWQKDRPSAPEAKKFQIQTSVQLCQVYCS